MRKKFIALLAFTLLNTATPLHADEEIPITSFRQEDKTYPEVKLYAGEDNIYQEVPVSLFRISNLSPAVETELDYTDWSYNIWEDCRYIYLPSTAKRDALTITYTAEAPLYLNDTPVVSGESTDILASSDEFTLKVGDTEYGKVKVMQSNLGCIYLDATSGSINNLDSNGNLTETGNILMLNDKGGQEYSGAIEKLTSHGNSSWSYSKKKPYNLKLPSKADLYGMGKAKKWMLISNYLDHSLMRNYFTMELSRLAGMDYVIDSVFVDFYVNGSYRGTYQLCERIQVQKNRLNVRDLEEDTEKINEKELDTYPRVAVNADNIYDCKTNSYKYFDIPNDPEDITGGYILQFQQWNRYYYKAESGFVTSRGQVVQLDSPEIASKAQTEYIREFMQELEDAIYSDTGYNSLGKHYSEYMDVDSLARAYLIEEISMNIDAGSSSFYMWKDSDITGDGKLHFAPVWDYDLAYGTFYRTIQNSEGDSSNSFATDKIYAACYPINNYSTTNTPESGLPTEGVGWLGKMYKKPEYKEIVSRVWQDNFEPALSTLLYGDNPEIMEYGKRILPSAEMNNALWHTYGGREYCVFGDRSGNTYMESLEMVKDFAQKRQVFLSSHFSQYTPTYILGDVNQDNVLDSKDAALLLMHASGVQKLDTRVYFIGDINGDTAIDAKDAAVVLQYTSGADAS